MSDAARAAEARRIARRKVASACVLAGLLALATASLAEGYGGLVPCALCLLERWPYRALVVLGAIGAALPRSFGRIAALLSVASMLAAAGQGGLHVGVEQGWWPSPLPECAAPRLSGDTLEERLASMPEHPAKPCDDPQFLVPGLPVSMAAMNTAYALAVALGIAISSRVAERRNREPRETTPARRPDAAPEA